MDLIATLRGGNGFPERFQGLKAGLHPFIKVSDLDRPGNERQIVTAENWLDKARYGALRPTLHPAGAIVFAKVGAALLLNRRRILSTPTAIDNNMMSVEAKTVDPGYLYGLMQTVDLGRICQGGGLPSVNQEVLGEQLVYVPEREEQRRIAAVLDTWNEAIGIAERLALLKQRRFAGVMQALINDADTTKEELINFTGTVGTKCGVDDGAFDESIELDNVESGSGQLIGRTSADGLLGQRACFEAGDTLFAKLRPYLRKSYFADEAGMASTEMWVLRANEFRCLPKYLNYLVRSDLFQAQADRPTGSRMPRADWFWVQETPLPLPGLNEQGRIVSILEAAESDWRVAANAVSALRRQKRGLMQKLLTGEWRVPITGDALTPGGPAADRLEAAE